MLRILGRYGNDTCDGVYSPRDLLKVGGSALAGLSLPDRMKKQSGPMLDSGLSGLLADLDDRGLLKNTLVVAVGEFGRSPKRGVSTSGNGNSADGRDHWPYCYTAVVAGAGIKRGYVYGKSDKTASSPIDNPVHPGDLLATIYHAVGINPRTIVYNHLNQPRDLVKADAVTALFG
jgi:arylsulfatase A-like enzyme